MKVLFTYIILMILLFVSCSEQAALNKGDKVNGNNTVVQNFIKIPVPKNGFNNAYLHNDGSIWFCSNGGGVYNFNGKSFVNYTTKDGLSSNQVFSITTDSKNNLWFGTQNGLTLFRNDIFKPIVIPYQDTTSGWIKTVYPTLSPNAVHALAVDDADLWIGTAGGGAFKYDGQNFESYLTNIGRKQEDSSYHNWIPNIEKDNKGNMWFASMTHGGVNRFNGKAFTQFSIKDGLSDSQVRTIYCDKSGKIWMGFNGNRNSGLSVYNGNTFTTYYENDGLCNKRIRAICEDKNGHIWLGSQLGNLCIYNGEQFVEFTYNGQTLSDILFIIEDLEHNIWFGGQKGIWKYDFETVKEMTVKEY